MTLYAKHLDEKEAFIGQLEDYKADIDAIVEANKKITNLPSDATPDDFFKALNSTLGDAAAVKTNYAAVRDALAGKK